MNFDLKDVSKIIKNNKSTIICSVSILGVLSISLLYGMKIDGDLKNEAIKTLHENSPEQLVELRNLSTKSYVNTLNLQSNLIYYDDSIKYESVNTILDCFVRLPESLQRLILGTGFKIKLTQFLNEVDGVTFYADRVILIEEFGHNIKETTFHEFGHILHVLGDIENKPTRLNEIYASESSLYNGRMKEYITSTATEYYAASFLEYMENPDKLKLERPKTYNVIKQDINSLEKISIKQADSRFKSYIKFGVN